MPHQFYIALMEKVEILDVWEEVPIVFELESGKAVGYHAKGIGTEYWIKTVRVK